MDIYVVVGRANTRKSSTIRALTGAHAGTLKSRKLVYAVEFQAVLDVLVLTQALQEAGLDAREVIQVAKKTGVAGAIVALRYAAKTTRGQKYLAAQNYVDEFRQAGWAVHVAYMDNSGSLSGVSSSVRVQPAPATNTIARQLRRKWGIA